MENGVLLPTTLPDTEPGKPGERKIRAGHVVLELDPQLIDPPPGNRPIDAAEVTGLLASIRDLGQQVPGIVGEHPEIPGRFLCYAGNRRRYCCDVLGVPFKAVKVPYPLSPAEAAKLRLTENVLRSAMNPIDILADIESVMREHDWNQKEAAEHCHLSQTALSRIMQIKRLAPDLRPLVENFSVCPTVAYLVASLRTCDQQRDLMKRAMDQKLTREQVQRLVDLAKGKKGAKPNTKPRLLTFKIDARRISLEKRPNDTAETLIETLKAVIGKLQRYRDLPVEAAVAAFAGTDSPAA